MFHGMRLVRPQMAPVGKIGALKEKAADIVRTTITGVAVQDMKRDPAGA